MQDQLIDSPESILRYSTNINLKNIDIVGQEKIHKAKVAIIGCGGLGSSVAKILCANGIGQIDLYDDDVIKLNNLTRQIIFNSNQINQKKSVALKKILNKHNKDTKVFYYLNRLNKSSMSKKINQFKKLNLILDCTDNWESRIEINTFCVKNNLAWLHAATIKNSGQVALYKDYKFNACYQCTFQDLIQQESCSVMGVSTTIINLIASIQANECLLYILEQAKLDRKLIFVDLNEYCFIKYNLTKNKSCSICA